MAAKQASEFRLPEAKAGTTERQIRLYNEAGDRAKTLKCKPTTTNTSLPVVEGWRLELVDLPDEKPVVNFVLPAKMPQYFDLVQKCEISVSPPTPPTGGQPEQNLAQHVQEPLTIGQSVGVQVVRADEDPNKMSPSERLAKGYKPELVDGKVQWKKATDCGTGQ
jgi:hypothetical protein